MSSLGKVIDEAIAKALGDVHTQLPGVVEAYDHETQTATIQPVIEIRFFENGQWVRQLPPPIPKVPVYFPSSDGYAITWPLATGSPVTLVFAERSTAEWRASGNRRNSPTDPLRRFDLSDAVALPGGRTLAAGITGPIPAAGRDPAAMVIWVATTLLLGGSAATSFVALAPLVVAELNALWAAHNVLVASFNALVTVYGGHFHSDPVSGVTGTASTPGVPATTGGPAGPVAATKVKAV